MTSPAPYSFKSAARRGVKELRREFGVDAPLGEIMMSPSARAEAELKFGPDALKKIMAERGAAEVGRSLGAGSEGVAYPAIGREGFGALKIHDPTADLYSPNFIEGKRKFIGHDNPHLAKIHYELKPHKINGMDAPAFMHEYIGGAPLDHTNRIDRIAAKNLEDSIRNYKRNGHAPIDVSIHNLKRMDDGTVKAVDFIGAPVSQLIPNGPRVGPVNYAFKKDINAPFFDGVNTLKGRNAPKKLRDLYGKDYGKKLMRGAFGGVRQTPKSRSPHGVVMGLLDAERAAPAERAAFAARAAARAGAAAKASRSSVGGSVSRAAAEKAPGFFRKHGPTAAAVAAALALAGGAYYATRPKAEEQPTAQ